MGAAVVNRRAEVLSDRPNWSKLILIVHGKRFIQMKTIGIDIDAYNNVLLMAVE